MMKNHGKTARNAGLQARQVPPQPHEQLSPGLPSNLRQVPLVQQLGAATERNDRIPLIEAAQPLLSTT